MFSRVKKTLKGEQGIFDLTSIIAGIVITSLLASLAVATYIFIVPWFQDKIANDDINLIKVAQDSQYNDKGSYGTVEELQANHYLVKPLSTKACVITATAPAVDYTVYVESESGKKFIYTPADAKTAEIADIPGTCR